MAELLHLSSVLLAAAAFILLKGRGSSYETACAKIAPAFLTALCKVLQQNATSKLPQKAAHQPLYFPVCLLWHVGRHSQLLPEDREAGNQTPPRPETCSVPEAVGTPPCHRWPPLLDTGCGVRMCSGLAARCQYTLSQHCVPWPGGSRAWLPNGRRA